MTIIANLDADIEQFYAEQGQTTRELQIFGRVWPLIPAMTSITLAPLMQIQAAAQMAQNGSVDTNDAETRQALFGFLGGVNDILANVIREDVRPEFKKVIDERGFPLGILPKVIEAIMQAFDAAPFDSGTTSTPQHPTNTPLLASNTAFGNSTEAATDTSTPTSTATPADTTPAATQPPSEPSPVVQPASTVQPVAEWDSEPRLKAYDESTALIPPSVQDLQPPAEGQA